MALTWNLSNVKEVLANKEWLDLQVRLALKDYCEGMCLSTGFIQSYEFKDQNLVIITEYDGTYTKHYLPLEGVFYSSRCPNVDSRSQIFRKLYDEEQKRLQAVKESRHVLELEIKLRRAELARMEKDLESLK